MTDQLRPTDLPAADQDKVRTFAEREAERERGVGIDENDAAARFLRGESALDDPRAAWRRKPATPGQVRMLRSLGANPLTYRSRGAASDEIASRKKSGR